MLNLEISTTVPLRKCWRKKLAEACGLQFDRKWDIWAEKQNLHMYMVHVYRIYVFYSTQSAYSNALKMSDATKFGVYGQEWAPWVFIPGCSSDTHKGWLAIAKLKPLSLLISL